MGKKGKKGGAWDRTIPGYHIYYDGNWVISRKNGPALLRFDRGKLRKIQWFWNGKLHRKTGPAVTWISVTGEKVYGFYIKGNMITTAKQYQRRAKLKDEDLLSIVLKYGEIGKL